MNVAAPNVPNVFDTFNARNLDPLQVAQTFIPPRHFDELILRNHAIVVGPRGSGKTTLLKMLQIPALKEWQHERADEYRSTIDFVGVFVAADVSWGAQLSALGGHTLREDVQHILGHAAFVTHILMALVRGMGDVLDPDLRSHPTLGRLAAHISAGAQAELINELAEAWHLEPRLPTISSLVGALRGRLLEISHIANQICLGARHDELFANNSFLFLGAIESVSFGVDQFNAASGQPYRKWGLLFDELEIAPKGIRQSLLSALRSTNQNILFKLSMSPYNEDAELLESSIAAMPGQDFQPIELWYARKEQGYEFSRALIKSMCAELGIEADPEEIFGHSYVTIEDATTAVRISAYRPGTALHRRFTELAARDPSFRDYLKSNSVDLAKMHLMGEAERAGAVRKITSIVALREAYRSLSDALVGSAARSRKNPSLFAGYEALLAIVEGNPRWLIGLIGPLLRRYASKPKRVPRPVQARAVSTASNRFRALLRTIPYIPDQELDAKHRQGSSRGLLSLLDVIGERFHRNVVSDSFAAEPVLSFTVDANAPENLLQALGKALNAGAIILVPDSAAEPMASSLRGKRFRLSYMLAPHFGLPLLLGRATSLNKILSSPQGETPLFDQGRAQ